MALTFWSDGREQKGVSFMDLLAWCAPAAEENQASRLPAAAWTHDRKDLLSMDSQFDGVTVSAWAIERLLRADRGGLLAGGVALWPRRSTFLRFRPW